MGRAKAPEQMVENILETATRLFSQKGYEKTSIQDIMDELDLSKGAIYHHFRSKEEILRAVMLRHQQKSNEQLAQLITQVEAPTAREKITRILDETTVSSAGAALDNFLRLQMGSLLEKEGLSQTIWNSASGLGDILEEGVWDQSIQAEHPKLLWEMICVLTNFWANPAFFSWKQSETLCRLKFIQQMAKEAGLDIIEDSFIAHYMEAYQNLFAQED